MLVLSAGKAKGGQIFQLSYAWANYLFKSVIQLAASGQRDAIDVFQRGLRAQKKYLLGHSHHQ
jgi:hypothetical protein